MTDAIPTNSLKQRDEVHPLVKRISLFSSLTYLASKALYKRVNNFDAAFCISIINFLLPRRTWLSCYNWYSAERVKILTVEQTR